MTTYEKIQLIKVRQDYQLSHAEEYGKKAEVLYKIINCKNDLAGYNVGRHTPANANWSFEIQIVSVEGELYEIVKRFGQVIAADWIGLPHYTVEELRINEEEI